MSTREQNLSSQVDALNNAGCIRIFTDKISGKEFKREGLTACLDYLRADDTLVIYRLDRLGRSVKEMLELCAQLEQRRIKLVSLQDNLDTSSAVGRFTMQILASLAEYNRNLILDGWQSRNRGCTKTRGQVRETGRYQDEETEERSRHPALQGWNNYTEDYGNNRY